MKKRILLIMSDTGGGHRTAAQAISEAIDQLYPNKYEVFIEDIWSNQTPWPINKIPGIYPRLMRSALPVWELIWLNSRSFQINNGILSYIIGRLTTRTINYLRLLRPDIVVSVHPLMNHLGIKWINEAGLKVPFVTVVTDLITIHPLWVCPNVTKCFVPTFQAQENAVDFGMPLEKIKVCGHPIRKSFLTIKSNKNILRKKLGINPTEPVVMIMSGGEGSGPIFETVNTLTKKFPKVQLLVITGRNKRLKEKLESVNWKTPIYIYNFVQNISELMVAADILVTKAGPGTIAEAFAVGVPLIIFDHVPAQEQGNVTYLLENHAGVYAKNPYQIVELIQEYIQVTKNNSLHQIAYNAAKLSKPLASVTIAKGICDLM